MWTLHLIRLSSSQETRVASSQVNSRVSRLEPFPENKSVLTELEDQQKSQDTECPNGSAGIRNHKSLGQGVRTSYLVRSSSLWKNLTPFGPQ